jgi:hypothetical protein
MGHLTQQELARIVQDADRQVTVGARYAHYKSADQYTVLEVALLEETDEPVVVYRAEYGEHIVFVRPLSVWLETVEWEGKQVPRFAQLTRLSPDSM